MVLLLLRCDACCLLFCCLFYARRSPPARPRRAAAYMRSAALRWLLWVGCALVGGGPGRQNNCHNCLVRCCGRRRLPPPPCAARSPARACASSAPADAKERRLVFAASTVPWSARPHQFSASLHAHQRAVHRSCVASVGAEQQGTNKTMRDGQDEHSSRHTTGPCAHSVCVAKGSPVAQAPYMACCVADAAHREELG